MCVHPKEHLSFEVCSSGELYNGGRGERDGGGGGGGGEVRVNICSNCSGFKSCYTDAREVSVSIFDTKMLCFIYTLLYFFVSFFLRLFAPPSLLI